MQKTFKFTIGTKELLIELPEAYTAIAAKTGFEAVLPADVDLGDFPAPRQTLLENGLVFELSVGLQNGKRKRVLISAENLGAKKELIGQSFGGSTIKSVSIRTYSKLG